MKDKNGRKSASESYSKDFKAVDFMRRRREEIGNQTEGMTPDEEIKFFAEKFVEYQRRKRK